VTENLEQKPLILLNQDRNIRMRLIIRWIMVCFFLTSLFSVSAENYKLIYKDGKMGLADAEGKVIIPAKYDELGWSNGTTDPFNNVIGYKSDGNWGILGLNNETYTANEYTKLYPLNSTLFVASKRGKISQHDFLGIISVQGKSILPFKYNSIQLVGLRAIVGVRYGRQYQYGVVDLGDKEIIALKYKEVNALGNLRFAVRDFNEKVAIYNDNGREVFGFLLDSISSFENGHAIIYSNHERGVINGNGEIVIQPKYKNVRTIVPLEIKPFNEWEIIGANKNSRLKLSYDLIEPYDAGDYRIRANKKMWIVNKAGEDLTPVEYSFIGNKINGKAIYKYKDKSGVINSDGSILIKAQFDSILLTEEVFYGNKKNEWALYDSYGVKKSNQTYNRIGLKTGYYFPVNRRGHWGFIDRSGEEIIHCVYDEVGEFSFNKVVVKFHGQYGIISKDGDWVVLPQKGKLKIINDAYYIIFNDNLSILKSYEEGTIYFTENRVEVMEDHLIEHLSDDGLWKIDFNGRIVNRDIPRQRFDEIRTSSEGLYAVRYQGRFGFVDNQNRLIVANRYENVGDFSEGHVSIKLLGRWGFIDRLENIVVQPVYESVTSFFNGLSIAKSNTGYGLIDKKGNKMTAFNYDKIELLESGRYKIHISNKYGLLEKDGSLLINAKYENLEDLGNYYVLVSLFGKMGVITDHGVDIIPIIYDNLIYDKRFDEYLAMKKSDWEKVSD
jgi:hypothetical protein